ncbi:MAG: fatty acid desaturase, partial [Candidatus Dadabacteria bacterium]|nr:fatty acid desaturase [Candidatus Dadabacteria bacterium]NIS07796.1 fatty acid desaturase [Candidatus Dadabacteria bacterium]NIV42848.1 fatty acid desaturase [Candidatus Dadabacteria bacterium]NIY21418.1 fatty acid desaturase [Candidatus Dadabacteria bacterium]
METIKTLHDLESIKKSEVWDNDGLTYLEFKKKLAPNYFIVWRDISLGYLALITSILTYIYIINNYPKLALALIPVFPIFFGYIIAFLHLFIHEAAHYNIARNRTANDILCNILLCSIIGLNIKSYRIIHWDHHRNLGETNDSEHSYFDPLNLRFLLESLLGYKAIKVILNRKAKTDNKPSDKSTSGSDLFMFLTGLIVNMSIVVVSFSYDYWQLSLAWIGGVFIFFPFFGALRQLLEHRDELADNDTDYSKV